MSGARILFGHTFQPSEALKAMVYFADGDLDTLAPADKALLIDAATRIDKLPPMHLAAATTN